MSDEHPDADPDTDAGSGTGPTGDDRTDAAPDDPGGATDTDPESPTDADSEGRPSETTDGVDSGGGSGDGESDEPEDGGGAGSEGEAGSGSETDLRTRIEAVRRAGAESDSLISLAVTPEEELEAVRRRIEKDHSEADRGDGAAGRHLVDALSRTKRVLQEYDETPENGLVVYVGVVEGDDAEYVFDDLPSPVGESAYVQDNAFHVGPLDALVGTDATFGLVVVERGGAALGRYENGTVETLGEMDSGVPGKTKAGGQSADRFERRREERKAEFFDEVAEGADRRFREEGAVDAVVVGGTTVTADEFRSGDHLPAELAELIVGDAVSVEYANERGLEQLAEKAAERIEEFERRPAADALERFFDGLAAGDDGVVYGPEETGEALEYEAVGTLLVADSLPVEDVRDYEERAEGIGAETVLVPTDSEDGERFEAAFGGVGALLRFPIE